MERALIRPVILRLSVATLLLSPLPAAAKEIIVHMKNQGAEGAMVFEPSFVKAAPGDKIRFLPTNPSHNAETMANYVEHLCQSAKSATIRRRINSLGTVLRLSKNHNPTKEPEVVLALKRMHRKIGRAQEQATPLTYDILINLKNIYFSL